MNEPYEPESPLSSYSEGDPNLDYDDRSYDDLISWSQPLTQTLAPPVASHKPARLMGRSAQANPLMPQIDAAVDPAPVTSNMHLPDQQGELVPPGTLLTGQWPTVTTTSAQANPLMPPN